MAQTNVVVIGAGVAGLTTAYLLSQKPGYTIAVVAKHIPGDYDIEYTSPWAGANYMPVSVRGSVAAQWDRDTWPHLEKLARDNPGAGVHFQVCEIYNRNKDASSATAEWFADLLSPNPWFRDVVPNFENLLRNNLDEDIESATRFTSVCINTAIYLPWLLSQCCEQGVTFRRGCFQHVREALELDDRKVDIVINCTGLGAARLGGVMDSKLTPARGQIVLVSNDAGGRMMDFSGTDDGADEACYVMSRAAGGGTVLGGSYQKGDWNPNVDHNLAIRIMKRAVKACPALTRGTGKIEDLDVLRHSVGLRPVREGGARVDKERLGEDGSWIVHNYGHGGAGYQCSYGCAEGVLKLVEEIRNSALRLSRL